MVTGGRCWVRLGVDCNHMLLWPCSEPASGPALAHVSNSTCNSPVVAHATQGCRADGLKNAQLTTLAEARLADG